MTRSTFFLCSQTWHSSAVFPRLWTPPLFCLEKKPDLNLLLCVVLCNWHHCLAVCCPPHCPLWLTEQTLFVPAMCGTQLSPCWSYDQTNRLVGLEKKACTLLYHCALSGIQIHPQTDPHNGLKPTKLLTINCVGLVNYCLLLRLFLYFHAKLWANMRMFWGLVLHFHINHQLWVHNESSRWRHLLYCWRL